MDNQFLAQQRDDEALQEALCSWWTQSMENHEQRTKWWKEARFGMFVHWGVSSLLGGMWQGKQVKGYSEHIMRAAEISMKDYIEKAVKPFAAEKFCAEDIIKAAHEAGMRYFIITAKHHDGFAMYPSDAYPYDIRMTKYSGDPMMELKKACEKYRIKFGFYYSHAYDWEHPNAPGNDWERRQPGGTRGLYAAPGRLWHSVHPELVEETKRYVDQKAIPQIVELIQRYQPDIMWFDTPSKLPTSENLRILKAIREQSCEIVINSRIIEHADKKYMEFADYTNTGDRAAEILDVVGQGEAIPTTNESYGYSVWDKTHKEPEHFIRLLIQATAKNTNVLLNIGPKGTGEIDAPDMKILKGIGAWMRVNGESIYQCGSAGLAPHSWGQVTCNDKNLYLHILHRPDSGKILLSGVMNHLKNARLLSDAEGGFISVKRKSYWDWEFVLPETEERIPVIAVEYEGKLCTEHTFFLSTEQETVLKVFDAQVSNGLKYGSGKRGFDYIQNWNQLGQQVRWNVRLDQPTKFMVKLRYAAFREPGADIHSYHTLISDADGVYRLSIGNQVFDRLVCHSKQQGEQITEAFPVTLPKGRMEITMQAKEITAPELMKLFAVVLEPLEREQMETAAEEYDVTDIGE